MAMTPDRGWLWLVLSGLLVLLALPARAATVDGTVAAERKAQLDRLAGLGELTISDWRWHPGALAHGESPALDDSGWETLKVGQKTPKAHGWLRRQIELPPKLHGFDVSGARAVLDLELDGDDLGPLAVYVDGKLGFYGDLPDPIELRGAPGQRVLVAVKINGAFGELVVNRATLRLLPPADRPDPHRLWESFTVAQSLVAIDPAQQPARQRQIDDALHVIDWASLERGDGPGFARSLAAAETRLRECNAWLKKYTVRVTGNAHIDMAWLWPWTETVDVVKRTFASALSLMRDYPEFTFSQSSAAAFAWIEDKYPALFDEIRKRVKEGRWELVGGMWVEPDLNMPDGESLVRQLFYGKRYFRERFGVDVRIGWNPDSFGYSRQLPQIYKRAGVDYFLTQKLFWNDTNKFPHRAFWWEAPDGSRVLSYFPTRYDGPPAPVAMAKDLADFAPRKLGQELMYLYGVGDHGGGPTRRMVEEAQAWQAPSAIYPRITFGTARTFFENLAKLGSAIPVWKDELYFEYHRGVFTTQAETKQTGRRSEEAVIGAEKLASLAWLFGAAYPGAALDDAWKKVLFNQFHDIAAGSGIATLYRDAARDYAEVGRLTERARGDALDVLTARVDSRGPGAALLVWNPLSWERTDVVEAELALDGSGDAVEVTDPDGQPLLAELIGRDPARNRARIRFVAERVPSLGYKVYHAALAAAPRRLATTLEVRGTTLENELVRVTVDSATGCITSLWDKRQQREALAPASGCANGLQAFADTPKKWDAWNIDADFEKQRWDITDGTEVQLLEHGPTRALIRVKHRWKSSRFVQDIALYPHVPRVDVTLEADWHGKHVLLKVAFPSAARSDVATYEVPYGTIERPTTRRNPVEQAKFEVPALRFADLSDAHGGLAILNDSKYGYDTKDNLIRLSVLRAPTWPDPHADEGLHRCTYALYPHPGTFRESDTLQRAHELNQHLQAISLPAHPGALPATYSFVSITPSNLVLSAVKKAADEDALVLRFYEIAGQKADATLRLPPNARRASETNLLEQDEHVLAIKGGVVRLPTGPYQIKSIKVSFSKR